MHCDKRRYLEHWFSRGVEEGHWGFVQLVYGQEMPNAKEGRVVGSIRLRWKIEKIEE